MTTMGILAVIAGAICALGLLAEWLSRWRLRRDDRREPRLLVMQEREIRSNGRVRTGDVEPHGLIPGD